MQTWAKAAVGIAAGGASALAYSAGYEVRAFRLREATVPCLPPGRRPLRVLHVSDLHLTPPQSRKQSWVRDLASLRPDLVVNTGDNLSHAASVPYVVSTFGPLLDMPGVFVFGSNDYWGPVAKNPLRYFLADGGRKRFHGPPLPWRHLRDSLTGAGWLDLTNARGQLTVDGTWVAFAGVDDPHLGYDRLDAVAGEADATAHLRLAVTHAPYRRVLDAFTRDGYDLILAGHTHGGQLRVPGYGALVTNCDLDRRRARGLSSHRAGGRAAWLHVSAGLGTSPYAPYRFACPPEATLLTLIERRPLGDAAAVGTPI